MNFTERKIVESYSKLLENLDSSSKAELIKNLSKPIKNKKKEKDASFFKSFGSFACSKSAEEIIKEIKSARKFRKRDLQF